MQPKITPYEGAEHAFEAEKSANKSIDSLHQHIKDSELIILHSSELLEGLIDRYSKSNIPNQVAFVESLTDQKTIDLSAYIQSEVQSFLKMELAALQSTLLQIPQEHWPLEFFQQQLIEKIRWTLDRTVPQIFEITYATWASSIDAKTGLYNPNVHNDIVKSAIEQGKPLGVLFCDIDLFGTINEALGHFITDGILLEIVKRIKDSVRKTDTVCRYGGDEISVLLPKVDTMENATIPAQKVCENATQPISLVIDQYQVDAIRHHWHELKKEFESGEDGSDEFKNIELPEAPTVVKEHQKETKNEIQQLTSQVPSQENIQSGATIDFIEEIKKYHQQTNQYLNFATLTKAKGALIAIIAIIKGLRPLKVTERPNGGAILYELNIQPSLSSVCTIYTPDSYRDIAKPKAQIEVNIEKGLGNSKQTRKALTMITPDGQLQTIPTTPANPEDTVETTLS